MQSLRLPLILSRWRPGALLLTLVSLVFGAQTARSEPIQILCRVEAICSSDACRSAENRSILITETPGGARIEVGPDFEYFHPEATYVTSESIGISYIKATLVLHGSDGKTARLELNVDRYGIPLGDGSTRPIDHGRLVHPAHGDTETAEIARCDYLTDWDRKLPGLVYGVYYPDYTAKRLAGSDEVFFHCSMKPVGKVSNPEHQHYGWDLWLYMEDPSDPDTVYVSKVKSDALWGAPLRRGSRRDRITDAASGFWMVVEADGRARITLRRCCADKSRADTVRFDRYRGTCDRGPAY